MAQQHNESVRWMWRLIGCPPRRTFESERNGRVWRWPNWGRPRTIPDGARIHESVIARMADPRLRYRPKLPQQYKLES